MNPTQARQFIPYTTGYYYNTWYPGTYNGNTFDVAVNKRQFLSVRIPTIIKMKDEQGNIINKYKGYKIYKQTKKDQWKYDDLQFYYDDNGRMEVIE